MPRYDLACSECGQEREVFLTFSEFDALRDRPQQCPACESRMAVALNELPTFIGRKKPGSGKRPRVRGLNSGRGGFATNMSEDDGFGGDNKHRRMAKRIAASQGVGTAGKRFYPQLCREGQPLDPLAWCGDNSEVACKVAALGRSCEGAFTVKSTPREEIIAKREKQLDHYQCSPQIVQPEVEKEIKEVHGGVVTPSKRKELTEKYVEIHSGTTAPKRHVKSLSRNIVV